MSILSACHAEKTALRTAIENFRRPDCPRCGSTLFVAEQSEFNLKGRIRHVWSCDDCGHEFVTSIRLWRH
jgi:ribosomal protein S27AE